MREYSRFAIFIILMLVLSWSVVEAAPLEQANLFERFILDARYDLERLATSVMRGESRPDGWTGNDELGEITFVVDLWFDNELLANEIFGPLIGPGQRPTEWIGATSANAELVARNIRHDLELATAAHYGLYVPGEVPGERFRFDNFPPEWIGATVAHRCSRTFLNILYMLDLVYLVRPSTPESSLNYCEAVSAEFDDELVTITLRNTDLEQDLPDLILAIRGDLERLADEKLGLDTRPPSWIGNRERSSPTLISDNFLDLESLADNQLGIDQRPPEWIGVVTNSAPISYRNLRHDLELLADLTTSADHPAGWRPHGWQGDDPVTFCEPNVQNLVFIVQQNYEFIIDVGLVSREDFCVQVEQAANNLIENPPVELLEEQEEQRFMAESRYAFAYLDRAAIEYMGIMPLGTTFRAWYRNFNESTMMFVSGDDFALYIDRRWTTLDEEIFRSLPTLEDVRPLTFCDARWCNGPGPTPTPTGVGPLLAIAGAATPPATIDAGTVSEGGKRQVSWNYIRVNYLLHLENTNSAQVTLEICQDVSQIACEPVVSVFDNTAGMAKPVISQYSGLNVYEFTYGYTSNLLIEGNTLFSTDIWLNDPALVEPSS